MSLAVGVDVPLSQMPAGMAFDGPAPGGGIGQSILGGIGRGVLSGLDSFAGGSSGGYGSYGSRTPSYSNQTRDMLGYLIREAMDSFEPAKSTI